MEGHPLGARSMSMLLAGKRRDEQFTVQAPLSVLRTSIPPSFFTPHLELITEGKAVGEAIRLTGPGLVYVRFPINNSGYPVSFTIPKKFLIPVTCRPLAKPQSLQHHANNSGFAVGSPIVGGVSALGGSSFTSPGLIGGSSFSCHSHVELNHRLGDDGEPAMCVVCGKWDESQGKKRRSGHKCHGCIGQKSLDRLRKEFERLLHSEYDPEDDVEIVPSTSGSETFET